LIAIADQGLALAGVGSLAGGQAALYAIPVSSFHVIYSGNNGYLVNPYNQINPGYNLVTGLGSPIARNVVAGLIATQGVYNVTGFPAPASQQALGTAAGPFVSSLPSSGGSSGLLTNSSSSSTNSSSLFPVLPNTTVVVVPVENTRVLVILPLVSTPTPLFASTSHPVQSQVTLPGPSTQIFNTNLLVGQTAAVDTLLAQRPRFRSEPELAALIDVVEPFQAPVPGDAPNKAAALSGPATTVMLPRRHLPILPRFDRDAALDMEPIGASPLRGGVAAPRGSEPETEPEPARTASTLAGLAATLAGGGYWLVFRDADRRKQECSGMGLERAFKPRVRRCFLPPR
jgi:hypothetical protein